MTEVKRDRFAKVPPEAAMNSSLSKRALRVLIALGGYTNQDWKCFPSQKRLAQDTGMARQTVNKAIQELCARGWLTKLKPVKTPSGKFSGNNYRVNVRRVTKNDDPCHHSGDTVPVTTVATKPCRQGGDTNNPIQQPKQYQPKEIGLQADRLAKKPSSPGKSPFMRIVNILEKGGMSQDRVIEYLSTLDPDEYAKIAAACTKAPFRAVAQPICSRGWRMVNLCNIPSHNTSGSFLGLGARVAQRCGIFLDTNNF